MALKKKSNVKSDKEDLLKNQINSKLKKLKEIQEEVARLEEELLSIKIHPFKIGDYALAEVPCGKGRKECKCLLECEHGTLYLRPVVSDGTLSVRHFSCTPVNKPYSDVLKKLED